MLGVLGGMGPMATVDFMGKVVQNTPATCDQEHIQMVVCSAANIPDRTAAILGQGADPFPAMRSTLRRLEAAGATCIAIPCNTAALRQTEGLIGSVIHLLGLALSVPDHTTLSRRAETLEGRGRGRTAGLMLDGIPSPCTCWWTARAAVLHGSEVWAH